MKVYKIIRGQISLELIMLMLVVVVGTVVAGTMIPNNIFNTTNVEDSKEVVFEGFIREGGTPVYNSEGGSSSDNDTVDDSDTTEDTGDSTGTEEGTSDNENDSDTGGDSSDSEEDSDTEEGNDDTEEGDNNETTTTGGNRAENLHIILKGTPAAYIKSDIIPDANFEPENESIYIKVEGNDILKYNVKGNINGTIEAVGTSELHLGNLSEIGTLNLLMRGTSQCNIGSNESKLELSIKKIDYLYIYNLTGTVDLYIISSTSTNITTMYVEKIGGNAGLILDGVYINTLTIGEIGGNSKLRIKNSIIEKVNGTNLNARNVEIINSTIEGQKYD